MTFIVQDTFLISGRGLVAVVERSTALAVGREHRATITKPDGTALHARAYREWLPRRTPAPPETDGFLLLGLAKEDVPVGSALMFEATTNHQG